MPDRCAVTDQSTGAEFVYTDPARSWAPTWWGGEPLWSTVTKAGLKSAVCMWPGPCVESSCGRSTDQLVRPEMADGTRPDRWYPFQTQVRNSVRHHPALMPSQDWTVKADLVASWLDLPLEDRPSFISVYLPEVDQEGHRTGPTSDQVNDELKRADDFAAALHRLIDERNLGSVVDLIFVSDHGMSSTADERVIYLDEILGPDGFAGIESKEGWPSTGLRFKPGVDQDDMLARLRKAASAADSGFDVYTSATMPPQWHFSSEVNDRIAPIYAVPRVGFVALLRADTR